MLLVAMKFKFILHYLSSTSLRDRRLLGKWSRAQSATLQSVRNTKNHMASILKKADRSCVITPILRR
jgi:hypothetical protein